ncbi:MAG: LacI family transcriptional regulator [Treponema sp.]|jgi:LacI family transcriptional regulator|nr:LacI family transcriptional regulator [Treponema sp.]
MAEKPTLKQIADDLGLSPATVSKAMAGKSEIKEATRSQVLSRARELGYWTKKKSEDGKGEFRAAVIIDEPQRPSNRNNFFDDVLAGFRQYAARFRMETVILSIQDEWRRQGEAYGEYFRVKKIDGVFIQGLRKGDPFVSCLESAAAPPAVIIDFSVNNPRTGLVEVDNVAAVKMAVDHLVSLGHVKIGFLNGHSQAEVSGKRLLGFAASLGLNGLAYNPDLVYEGDFTEGCGGAAADYFIRLGVTAVFCASDLMAVGLIHGFQHRKLRIPDDVSVVGFDNMSFCNICTPKITTVAQDRNYLGMTACALLRQLIDGGIITRCTLSPSFIIRESTKAPRHGKAPVP